MAGNLEGGVLNLVLAFSSLHRSASGTFFQYDHPQNCRCRNTLSSTRYGLWYCSFMIFNVVTKTRYSLSRLGGRFRY